MNYYEKLRNKVEMKGEIQDFKEVNKCIKDILSDEYKDNKIKIDIIKSLICHFEGKLNKANYLMVITIGFALVICAISLFGLILDKEENVIIILCLLVLGFTAYVSYESVSEKKNGYKDAFILKALYFKLDELNKKSGSSVVTGTTSESGTENEVDTINEQDNKNNCKKYIVRVYNR